MIKVITAVGILSLGLAACETTGTASDKSANLNSPVKLESYDPIEIEEPDGSIWFGTNSWLYKRADNIKVGFKRWGEWVIDAWFVPSKMRMEASLGHAPNLIISKAETKNGDDPALIYSCLRKDFSFNWGRMYKLNQYQLEQASYVWRFDGKHRISEKLVQAGKTRTLKGTNEISGEPEGKPSIGSSSYENTTPLYHFNEIDSNNPLKKFLDHKIVELTYLLGDDQYYHKWVFEKPVSEMKSEGQFDKACELMLGADYITIKTQNPSPSS